MTPAHLEPMARRRRDPSSSRMCGLLKSWRVLVFVAAVIITTWNLNRSLSSHHKTHVSKGIQRQHLSEKNHDSGSDGSQAAVASDLHLLSRHTDAESRGAAALLRGKAQVKRKQERTKHPLAGGKAGSDGSTSGSTGDAGTERQCHVQEHAEYAGDVVKWGAEHRTPSADQCCEACEAEAQCNVWVWCGSASGCGGGERQHQECWLKHQQQLNVLDIEGSIGAAGSLWTSGVVYSDSEKATALAAVSQQEQHEAARLLALKNNESLPLVYFDVEIKGEPVGRMLFVLFIDEAPLATENFRQFCTGEKGLPYHFKGSYFYRIIDRFIDQTGADTESVYGGMFKDDPGGLKLKHDRKGLLSAANTGTDTNTAHFSILQAPAPHLNGKYTIFGELVEGWPVAARINKLSLGKKDNTAGKEEGAKIVDVGQLRKGAENKLAAAALMNAQTTLVH